MSQFFRENAHNRIDLKKYQDNFDTIDWSSVLRQEAPKNPEHSDESVSDTEVPDLESTSVPLSHTLD